MSLTQQIVVGATVPMRIFLIVLLTAAATSGCAKKAPLPVTAAPAPLARVELPPAPAPPTSSVPGSTGAPLTDEELFGRKTLEELNAERPLGDALFDLDAVLIRSDARDVLERNAEWLRRWPSTRITVEGHCDERGTSEYNLALGEQRASAVKRYLMNLGIDEDRVVTVSKGKEVPVCAEGHEGCWQQNRRGRSIITAK